MKHSEFQTAIRDVFGAYGSSLCADLVLGSLDGHTPDEALAQGVPPQRVWDAICAANDLPARQRFPHRQETRKPNS